jgi:hypothetical protein
MRCISRAGSFCAESDVGGMELRSDVISSDILNLRAVLQSFTSSYQAICVVQFPRGVDICPVLNSGQAMDGGRVPTRQAVGVTGPGGMKTTWIRRPERWPSAWQWAIRNPDAERRAASGGGDLHVPTPHEFTVDGGSPGLGGESSGLGGGSPGLGTPVVNR